jgi:hypothetical protein
MDRERTAAIISDVERAVNFVDRFADPDIYRLLDELKIAFREKDEEAIRKKARQIVDHGRYAAVVEEADRLLK